MRTQKVRTNLELFPPIFFPFFFEEINSGCSIQNKIINKPRSNYVGVSGTANGRYEAYRKYLGIKIHGGVYDTEIEAAFASDKLARKNGVGQLNFAALPK